MESTNGSITDSGKKDKRQSEEHSPKYATPLAVSPDGFQLASGLERVAFTADGSGEGSGSALRTNLLLKDHTPSSSGSSHKERSNPFVTPDKYVDRLRFPGIPRSPFMTPPNASRSGSLKTSSSKSTFSGSGHRYNPFEGDIHQLTMPSFSPSVFANVVSPSASEKEFRWSIDHMACLKPVNITDSPLARQYRQRVDPAYESKVQEAIDVYFNQAEIAPSPMSEPVLKPPIRLSHQSSFHETEKFSVSTQTELSFPLILPHHIEELLKLFMTECTVERVPFVQEDLENSSFRRRKLFGDTSSNESESENSFREGTPDFAGQVEHNDSICPDAPTRGSLLGTPRSVGISSSPITPPDIRMASLIDDNSNSPPISPIAHLKSRIVSESSKTARKIDLDSDDMSVISFSDAFIRRTDLMSSTAFLVAKDFEFTKIQPITELDESKVSDSSENQDNIPQPEVKPVQTVDTGYSTFFQGDNSTTNTDMSVPCAGTVTGVKRPLPVSPAVSREPVAQVGTPIGCSTPTK